jgi:hypothetical protein
VSCLHFVYVDDSGERPRSFALGAVLVPAAQWNEVLDRLVAFRVQLSKDHGFRTRWELHATDFAAGAGDWHALKAGRRTRWGVYKRALGVLGDLAPVVQAFGVAVPDVFDRRLRAPARLTAWSLLLERLERYTVQADSQAFLIADSGNQLAVRRLIRQRRRYGPVPSRSSREAGCRGPSSGCWRTHGFGTARSPTSCSGRT